MNVAPVLEVSGLSKSFGALAACSNIDLTLNPGEIHALIGPNGAGKSTCMKLIGGELAADAGRVRFLGQDMSAMPVPARARAGLARTFQVSSLFPDFTVFENALMAVIGQRAEPWRFFRAARRDRKLRETALEAVARFGLADRANDPVSAISHGERRQLEVALAVAMQPRAILMDEPMAGIGPGGTRELTGVLDALRTEAPILLVEHDMDAVFALADRISVLVGGRILVTGTPDTIRNDPRVQDAYLGGPVR